jgi:hypothetical protein
MSAAGGPRVTVNLSRIMRRSVPHLLPGPLTNRKSQPCDRAQHMQVMASVVTDRLEPSAKPGSLIITCSL